MMAIPRIKLMRNKKEAQAKQLRRELAQLLVAGQDQTARIRVEHAVREEKSVEAYNLLEIYCELIVARMQMVESQKECPLDLKEAIASVIYASARCEDVPELKDASKHFTAKYGKEFTSAALDLRPNCGVGRMLVEKLSAKAPDGPTKLRILTAIAEEHNIEWDPASFGAKESKVYDDMLKGPNAFIEAVKVSAYPSNIQPPSGTYEQRLPSVQVPKHVERNDMPTSFSEYNSRSTPHPKDFTYSNTSADNLMSSETYSPNSKPHGTGNQGFRHSYSGNESAYSSPRHHWNMDFKDATTAAQVAAESAELASMAARAAAELSSRGNTTQQYFMESPMSPLHHMRDEEPRKYTGSASQNESSVNHKTTDAYSFLQVPLDHFAQVSLTRKSSENDDHQNVKGREQSSYSYSQSNRFTDDHDVFSNFNRLKSENDKRNSGESRMPFVNELHATYTSDFTDYQEVGIQKQSSRSSAFSYDHGVLSNLNRQSSENNKGSLQRSKKEATYSFNNEDHFDFEEEHEVYESSMSLSSPRQRSPTGPFTKTKSWITETNVESRGKTFTESHIFSEQTSFPVFFESSTSFAAQPHGDDLPSTFDNYGPSSESDKEIDKTTIARSTKPSIGSNDKSMDSQQVRNSTFNPQFVEVIGDTELFDDSSPEEGMKLNFGNLTGGLRHKGYRLPTYTNNSPRNNDASTRIQQPSPPAAVEASVGSVSYNQEPYSRKMSDEVNRKLNMRASSTRVDPSDDDSEEERPKQTSSGTRDRYNKTPSIEENQRSSTRVAVPYFGSGNSGSDEALPKTNLNASSNTGFSRRTKASPSNSQRSSNLKATFSSEPSVGSDYGEVKNSSRSSNADSNHLGSFQHPRLSSQATSRLVSEFKRSSSDIPFKSSEKEQSPASVPKIITSASAKSLTTQTSISEGQSKQNASHVHPKLPDIDILTAHFNSIRQNRQ